MDNNRLVILWELRFGPPHIRQRCEVGHGSWLRDPILADEGLESDLIEVLQELGSQIFTDSFSPFGKAIKAGLLWCDSVVNLIRIRLLLSRVAPRL